MTEEHERLKFAVFIDFDNIEIGVRTTLSRRFDIDSVLEAIKERGEVVTKVAYGNWKRADEYSQAMTEHAVQMVQRNVTPRGDKNGADINLALDALEMAFTRDHINAFVIVGGDSDFIALVEKLKQYDKTVFIVGGRAFTSTILQRNCHEFIAYENLIVTAPPARKPPKVHVTSRAQLEDALPLIRRALKILADREVSPQLGLLKSTLLQLDSTFSEKDYGTGSFRDFIEKLADGGHLSLKQVDRSLIVEMKSAEQPAVHAPAIPAPVPQQAAAVEEEVEPEAQPPVYVTRAAEPGRDLAEIFRNARVRPRWPMYLRNMKQYLRSLDSSFDERSYGFGNIHDLVRQGQREGLLRIERNRQGILRIFPGDRFPGEAQNVPQPELEPERDVVEAPLAAESFPETEPVIEPAPESAVPQEALPAESPSETALPEPPDFVPSPEPVQGEPTDEKRARRRRAGSGGTAAKRKKDPIPRKPRTPRKKLQAQK